MGKLRVAVLMGGDSSERDISLKSGTMVLRHLDRGKYDVVGVDLARLPGREDVSLPGDAASEAALELLPARTLIHADPSQPGRPDVVFIAMHGRGGEDGTVQGLLELLGLPYTGSGVLASALALNKALAKKVFVHDGIRTPAFVSFTLNGSAPPAEIARRILDTVGLPCVVKPACEGSTIGMSFVHEAGALPAALQEAQRYDREIVVERFIRGVEITAGILGNDEPQVLPLVEIVPQSGVYDYEAKYTPGATEEIVPARIPEAAAEEARRLALAAHRALGCRGISRVDMIVAADGVHVLEVNTIPGLTETSLVPCAARAVGISFPELLDRLVALALEAHGGR
jgi:D-alanine-D-alanine ligase